MSLLNSLKNIGSSILSGVVGYFTGGPAGAAAGVVSSVAQQRQERNQPGPVTVPPPRPSGLPTWSTTPPITTAGSAGGGLTQTLPSLSTGTTVGSGVPSPGGLMRSLGQLGGGLVAGALGAAGGGGFISTKRGRLTGNFIPRGYVEKMSPQGVIYLAKQRRRRGITGRDLSSFYRVSRLVSKIHGRAHRSSRRGK